MKRVTKAKTVKIPITTRTIKPCALVTAAVPTMLSTATPMTSSAVKTFAHTTSSLANMALAYPPNDVATIAVTMNCEPNASQAVMPVKCPSPKPRETYSIRPEPDGNFEPSLPNEYP